MCQLWSAFVTCRLLTVKSYTPTSRRRVFMHQTWSNPSQRRTRGTGPADTRHLSWTILSSISLVRRPVAALFQPRQLRLLWRQPANSWYRHYWACSQALQPARQQAMLLLPWHRHGLASLFNRWTLPHATNLLLFDNLILIFSFVSRFFCLSITCITWLLWQWKNGCQSCHTKVVHICLTCELMCHQVELRSNSLSV